MECITKPGEGVAGVVGDVEAWWRRGGLQGPVARQSGPSRRRCQPVPQDFRTEAGIPAPVVGDVGQEPRGDRVPGAGARGQRRDRSLEPRRRGNGCNASFHNRRLAP
jgi:hypothetical protein